METALQTGWKPWPSVSTRPSECDFGISWSRPRTAAESWLNSGRNILAGSRPLPHPGAWRTSPLPGVDRAGPVQFAWLPVNTRPGVVSLNRAQRHVTSHPLQFILPQLRMHGQEDELCSPISMWSDHSATAVRSTSAVIRSTMLKRCHQRTRYLKRNL